MVARSPPRYDVQSSHGYNSGNDPRLLFGLGTEDEIDSIEVTWPGGNTQILKNQEPGQTITIEQPDDS